MEMNRVGRCTDKIGGVTPDRPSIDYEKIFQIAHQDGLTAMKGVQLDCKRTN
jgi:hypothetical protein